jgi:membrane protein
MQAAERRGETAPAEAHKGVLIQPTPSSTGSNIRSLEQRIWAFVSRSPLESLWDLHGVPARAVAARVWKSILSDRLFGHAAELGFYFLFALFPTLFCAGSILGLAAQSAHAIYDRLLDYLALVIPTSALGTVLSTFNETAAAASSGKITFSSVAAIWSASVGISAMQDTLNDVYKIKDSRSYIVARIYAIGLTLLLTAIVSVALASVLGGDVIGKLTYRYLPDHFLAGVADIAARVVGRIIALSFLILSFAVIYYWAPDLRKRRWRWFTPGAMVGIIGWLLASLGLRLYLHFFNNYSVTYGSLGAVIILLTWFYITGLMLLMGAEINSQIEAAAVERQLLARPRLDDVEGV